MSRWNRYRYNWWELKQIFDSIDGNGIGLIEYQEFIRNACDFKTLMNESNLKNVFHPICDDKDIMSGEDIKKFVFHDSAVHEQTLNEWIFWWNRYEIWREC